MTIFFYTVTLYKEDKMFTTKIVVILLIILIGLGVFLYYLNELTQEQAREEESNIKNKNEGYLFFIRHFKCPNV